MAKIKAVVDTNVFVKALIGSQINHYLYNAFLNGLFNIILSQGLLEELAEVLLRPKLGIDIRVVKEFFKLINSKIIIVNPKIEINVCRDPSDNIVLETAITGKADFIITNDNDLLIIKSFRNIPILNPYKFLEVLKA